jgi:hypothetical protein
MLALVALAAVALLQGGGATAATPRIAFEHAGHVWTMAPDGSDRRRLVRGGAPAYSPDGTSLAFLRASDEATSVWVAAADGTGARRLVDGGSAPAWSPDGGQIAYQGFELAEEAVVTRIEVIRPDGAGRRTVVEVRSRRFEGAFSPEWMPGGERIAYTRTRVGRGGNHRFEVRSVRLDGSDDRLFLAGAKGVAFSPDGTRVAIADTEGAKGQTCGSDECYPDADLSVAAADGSGRTAILRTPVDEPDPAWSPDGTRIAFSSARNGHDLPYDHPEIYTVAPDGSCLTWLTNGAPESGSPAWSPATGPATPATCGMAGRPATAGVRLRRAQRQALWLGTRFGTSLLSDTQGRGRQVIAEYTDCAAFEPAACDPGFVLVQDDACGARGRARLQVGLGRAGRVGNTLLLPSRDITTIVSGRSSVGVQIESPVTSTQSRSLLHRIARGLRTASGGRPGRPRVPARERRRLPPRLRALVRPC